jgi:aspartate racemase
MRRTVGILGGMGPEATVALMSRVIAAVSAKDDADHVPLIVDQNPQVPSRIAKLIEGRGDDPAPVLAMMAQRLERAGAAALAMPCNTAHAYADDIRAAVAVPFLDMVALSVAEVARAGADTVGILASPAVRRVGVFDAALAGAGIRAVYPADQDALLAAIRIIKTQGPVPDAHAVVAAASDALAAPVQLIACTEFSLLRGVTAPGVTAIDPLDVLTRAIVDFSTGVSDG